MKFLTSQENIVLRNLADRNGGPSAPPGFSAKWCDFITQTTLICYVCSEHIFIPLEYDLFETLYMHGIKHLNEYNLLVFI